MKARQGRFLYGHCAKCNGNIGCEKPASATVLEIVCLECGTAAAILRESQTRLAGIEEQKGFRWTDRTIIAKGGGK